VTLFQEIFLAIIQGLTEFLPISSSAHLILPSALLHWPDQGLAFDVAVHVGTLMAVMVYFRRDIAELVIAWTASLVGRGTSAESRMGWYLILATIPAGIAGLLLDDFIESNLRHVGVIASTTILFGLLLGLADRFGKRSRDINQFTWTTALIVGLAQAVALIPGTSRSGITITAALLLGFDRVTAARFSFLLAIPIIVLSGGYKGLQLSQVEHVPWANIATAALISAVTAYLCIHTFLTWINRIGMMPFVWYRLLLGAVLVVVLAAR